MSPTLRYSVIAVMLLSTTALGIIAYHAMNPPPPPAPPPAPVVETPPVVVQPPVVELPPPAPWVCPYDLVQSAQVQDALAVKPCSLHGGTHLVASTKAQSREVDASKTTVIVSSAGSTREFTTTRTKILREEQTPEEWAAMIAAYEAYPTTPAKREAYIARMLKKGTPDLDDIPNGPPPGTLVKLGTITIPAEENGHHYPKVTINGQPLRMVADTGASRVSFNEADARKVGLDPKALPKAEGTTTSNTANGPSTVTLFTLPEITVEGVVLRDVPAACCNKADESLLGVTALKRFNVSFTKGWMVLSPLVD
jgi:clan AA aspartic protease (TIGR02281 family)